jgi:RES domain-containing protein
VPVDWAAVAAAPPARYRGRAYRHQAPGFDPLSGAGARLNGGRFNPPNSFPVLYLCQTRACTVAELRRLGQGTVIGVEGLLPRALYEYQVRLDRVLDLTSPEVVAPLGLSAAVLTSSDWTVCRDVGEAAHAAGFQAITSPSATGVDEVLAVFPASLGGDHHLLADLAEEWSTIGDLPPS